MNNLTLNSLPFSSSQMSQLNLFEPDEVNDDLTDASSLVLLQTVFSFYSEILLSCSRAIQFLHVTIGQFDKSFIEVFNIGFVDRTLGKKLPHSESADGSYTRTKLQRIGLFKPSGHEAFRGAIVVPLFDLDGNIVGNYGIWIGPNYGGKREKTIIWDKRDFGIFNPSSVRAKSTLIFCRTPIEAALLWNLGYQNVISVKGCIDVALAEVFSLGRIQRAEIFQHDASRIEWSDSLVSVLKNRNINHSHTNIGDYKTLC